MKAIDKSEYRQWMHNNITFSSENTMMHPHNKYQEILYPLSIEFKNKKSIKITFRISKFPGNCGILVIHNMGNGTLAPPDESDFENAFNFIREFAIFHRYTCITYSTTEMQNGINTYFLKNKWRCADNIFQNLRTLKTTSMWYKLVGEMKELTETTHEPNPEPAKVVEETPKDVDEEDSIF